MQKNKANVQTLLQFGARLDNKDRQGRAAFYGVIKTATDDDTDILRYLIEAAYSRVLASHQLPDYP